jgi:hypothetical protein
MLCPGGGGWDYLHVMSYRNASLTADDIMAEAAQCTLRRGEGFYWIQAERSRPIVQAQCLFYYSAYLVDLDLSV